MAWIDDIVKRIHNTDMQIINDAKSPSGQPHVGSLRGIIIHDAPFRYLKEKGVSTKFIYGSDDYDPLDELPKGYSKEYEKYLGMPLCNVPAPEGSIHSDLAMHFISDFFKIFDELGVQAEKYYMRDIYRNGVFNEAIDKLLSNVEKIREIYLRVSNSERANNWYPFQVVCEKCGKLGTTVVTNYDGKLVDYECNPNLVTWATGCGHKGKMSPFNGGGKLPYKVEWAAKWAYMNITIEGGGTDHNTKGGSRDVAEAIYREIFKKRPPLNIPYGFFMLEGKKMSSSKGIGATARDMTNFLPPEVLRYLMFGSHPKREVNFAPNENYITKLFNDFDRLHNKFHITKNANQAEKNIYNLAQVFSDNYYFTSDFSLIITLLQLPHKDIYEEAEKLKDAPLTEFETQNLNLRIRAAKYWLDNIAPDEDKLILQKDVPENAQNLTVTQKAFLENLAKSINNSKWTEKDLQTAMFSAARLTPILPKDSFEAFYTVLLDKKQGPKAGNLMYFLEKEYLLKMFTSVKFDRIKFWKHTSLTVNEFEFWLNKEKSNIVKSDVRIDFINREKNTTQTYSTGVIEFTFKMTDNKTYLKRIYLKEFFEGKTETQKELEKFKIYAKDYIEKTISQYNIDLN